MPRRYVGGIVFDGVRVLLGRRSVSRERYPGVWDIFGGHIEHGETPRAALSRELLEELGIEIVGATAAGTLRGTGDPEPVPFIMDVFVVWSWSGHPRLANHEHDAIQWFHPDELDARIGVIDERLPEFVQAAVAGGLFAIRDDLK